MRARTWVSALMMVTMSAGGIANAAPAPDDEIDELLAGLEVAAEGSMDGYDRDEFPHWKTATVELGWEDADDYDCNVRWAALWRDGHELVWDDPEECEIASGYWEDEYGYVDPDTGEMDPYVRSEDAQDFDIDHIVALALGWRSGADEWTREDRTRFANDPLNVEVSDLRANRSKGDQSADTYLPPGEFRCEYTERYVEVKAKYELTVTQAEHDALAESLEDCAV